MQSVLTDKVVVGGLYRHFKGDLYVVTDVVHHSEDWDNLHVVYYDIKDPQHHRVARPLKMFIEGVTRIADFGYQGPRFELVKEEPVEPDWKSSLMKVLAWIDADYAIFDDQWHKYGISEEDRIAILHAWNNYIADK